jgi:CO/xanthine dehydrogenase Mo-binding subunit
MPELDKKSWRNDAYAKVTGRAKFTDDLKFANLLHAAPVYSDYVHARSSRSTPARRKNSPA